MQKLMGTTFFRTILILFLFLSCALTALATAQAPDKLIYSGQERKLFSNPLEAYYENSGTKRPNFMSRPFVISSGNWRGYVATWEIVDGKLFLLNVDSSLCEGAKVEADCKQVQLSNLFPSKVSDGKVFADWYSGELRVPDGEQIVYVHMGYGSVYERDLIFTVADGMVEGPKVIDNTKEQLPSEMDIALKELEKLKESPLGSQPAFSRPEKGQVSADYNDQHTGEDVIVPGEGVFSFGTARKEIELVIGGGEPRSQYSDVYFIDYPRAGIQVSYVNGKDTVRVIYFYNNQTRYEHYASPSVRTAKGIDWTATAEDVIKAHGKPVNDFGKVNGSWRRLEYAGIDFRFEGGKLRRIGILPPKDQ